MKPSRFVRNHPWLSLAALTLLSAGSAFYYFVLREGPVNYANFERIEEGMTPVDLASFLGEPVANVLHAGEEAEAIHDLLAGPGVLDAAGNIAYSYLYLTSHRYRGPSVQVILKCLCKDATRMRGRTQRWQDGDRAIVVVFDTNDRAVTASFETTESTPSLWTRVKTWFQNLWRRVNQITTPMSALACVASPMRWSTES